MGGAVDGFNRKSDEKGRVLIGLRPFLKLEQGISLCYRLGKCLKAQPYEIFDGFTFFSPQIGQNSFIFSIKVSFFYFSRSRRPNLPYVYMKNPFPF